MRLNKLIYLVVFSTTTYLSSNCYSQTTDTVLARFNVTLKQAHVGSLEIDSLLLNSYETVPENISTFYFDTRALFEGNEIDFTHTDIVASALNNEMKLMGGPMLGDVKSNGISIWLRPSNKLPIYIRVTALNSNKQNIYSVIPIAAGMAQRMVLDDLNPATKYKYAVISQDDIVAEGTFQTAPELLKNDEIRLTFASGFHKIGLHNPNIINAILKREPNAMLLLGDLAVDDRENNFSMHRSDYLLRDISKPWKKLSANIPLYASWDDHDYLDNDLSGIPEKFTKNDRDELRAIWRENWNNPENNEEGIYFNTRIGQVEVIMLDTRSCRTIEKRGQYGSYLGLEQQTWLKNILKNSTAAFKIISSGTMWSDDISNGKDSWGTWDTLAREEIFNFIETENILGVLLISGDRHGARGFTIPRPSGFKFFEFEPASLGGVPGPEAIAKNAKNQLFGYPGLDLKAFGEFTFKTENNEPQVIFRLIDEFGNIMEEHRLSYDMLTPKKIKR
ncbi:alkaline phosphatase D family protein [Algibacter miyuki]|uniref:Alkaline phosphatase D family protein n=1 Tax=Algibacter miyuki TaxID=1306933 RepID=A0ABV5GUV0_9FLAO|nr:alkaline phosphatase D family protein [Algibacter miyuki]MDN3664726.1 alkaline phosphatase D family protein [Algibacter miyuki]